MRRSGFPGAMKVGEPVPDWEIKPTYTYQEAADIWDVSYRMVQGWVGARKVLKIDKRGRVSRMTKSSGCGAKA